MWRKLKESLIRPSSWLWWIRINHKRSQRHRGSDRLFVNTPSTADRVALTKKILTAAVSQGVKYISPLWHHHDRADTELAREHKELEDALASFGVSYTYFAASLFFENNFGNAGMIKSGTFYSPLNPDAKINTVAVDDIGLTVAHSLAAASPNEPHVSVTGPEAISLREQLAVFERVLGKKIELVTVGYDDFAKTLQSFGVPDWQVTILFSLSRAELIICLVFFSYRRVCTLLCTS